MSGKNRLDKAVKQLADLIETHLDNLPAKERERKERAFHNVVANVDNRAKSSERPKLRRAVAESDGTHSLNKLLLGCDS
jgi:hypothetical protein